MKLCHREEGIFIFFRDVFGIVMGGKKTKCPLSKQQDLRQRNQCVVCVNYAHSKWQLIHVSIVFIYLQCCIYHLLTYFLPDYICVLWSHVQYTYQWFLMCRFLLLHVLVINYLKTLTKPGLVEKCKFYVKNKTGKFTQRR